MRWRDNRFVMSPSPVHNAAMSIVHRTLRNKVPTPDCIQPPPAGGERDREQQKALDRERARSQALSTSLAAAESALATLQLAHREALQKAEQRETELRLQVKALTARLGVAGGVRAQEPEDQGNLLAQAKARKG